MRFLYSLLCTLLITISFIGLFSRVAAQTKPTFPNSYHLFATMSLPYAEIREPIEVWYNGPGNAQRTQYYGGLDVYVERPDLKTQWQVNPVITDRQCFTTNATEEGDIALQNLFPDLSQFTVQPATVMVDGVECYDWQYINTVGQKTNTYDFYVTADTNRPYRYQMMGYDSLLGSHYDLYVLDYNYVESVVFGDDSALFQQPAENCGAFPGPGAAAIRNPLKMMSHYFPSSSSSSSSSSNDNTNEITDDFRQFMKIHNRLYDNDQELHRRFNLYKHNTKLIHHTNHKNRVSNKSLRLAVNHFADYSDDELAGYRGVKRGQRVPVMQPTEEVQPTNIHYYDDSRAIPASIDWRQLGAVNPPKDQGVCGSCWSFGTVGTLEGSYFLATKQLVKFSEQELMDCSWEFGNNACDGGEDFRAYGWMMKHGGLGVSSEYGPYLMADGLCHSNSTKPVAIISGYTAVNQGDVDALLQATAAQGPISVSIDASHKSLSFYSSGVYVEPDCKNGPDDLDHSVLVAGYGTLNGEDYWIIKNSWSTYWGLDGYVLMSRKNNMCGVATAATYAHIVAN